MDITSFVVSGREKAKLFGDYSTYRTQLSNRIHNLRKKLGIATKPRAKYTAKAAPTVTDIRTNHEHIHLLLLTSERAWAHAMSMREIHSTDTKGITGTTRSHIISRLHKATVYANDLFLLLRDQSATGATGRDVLEARAYVASLNGAMHFEKQSWEFCVRSYSEARIIYNSLYSTTKTEIFKDLLSDPVDVSIRYGAYQMRIPRTKAIPAISREYFPTSDSELVSQIEEVDPNALNARPTKVKDEAAGAEAAPKTITWRSRTVDLEDAAIAAALGSVQTAVKRLSDTLTSTSTAHTKDVGAAYDDVLILSQDAVDATKQAIDELVSERVGSGDKRMQSLQITRTAVSYEMISWRIGRNRVLVGESDGAVIKSSIAANTKHQKSNSKEEEGTGRKLSHLREKVVLYDAILQSLDSIKELPGIAADSDFIEEINAKAAYFSALKCLSIARSHALLPNLKNALALVARAAEKCNVAYSYLSTSMDTSTDAPPNISISSREVTFLKDLLSGEVQRYRALVELSNLARSNDLDSNSITTSPLVERLHEYPMQPVNLENLVTYPPRLEPIPVKPLFFDAAWNYIEYPGRQVVADFSEKEAEKLEPETKGSEPPTQQKKKGWLSWK
ncbi:hypothetical protein GLAREA_01729 [Glarea lozoyensis ATCC 20868]|uniref:Signal recognition particle subunit SRP68 n=1 Tax=Glarea lozoyensis (strain ATCC 20868 / MF5171) TaxID=1116229 RepID=S3CH89_GLAL2|nr:uncharacterized protein GLAREA_01729 [Glarea lozoyensis ATCC 20868]EPE25817.1 hypothetical protein GLAREA_01729 [Glarea lozoyensis ATCC 20868]